MLRSLPLFLIACTAPTTALQSPPPTLDLELFATAAIPGQTMNFTVEGLAPGEEVYIGRGPGLGSGPCLSIAGGTCLGITGPVSLMGRPLADASGVANLTLTAPPTLPLGVEVGFQAIALRGAGGADSVFSNSVLRVTTDTVLSLDDLSPGALVVTEVMANPAAVTDANGEWFEIHNTRPHAVDLQGLRVEDDGGAGFNLEGPVILEAGGYAVLSAQADPALNGGLTPDAAWAGFNLSNSADEIVLSFDGVEFDRMAWDGWGFGSGSSLQLSADTLSASANDHASAWCDGTDSYGLGDRGTPGEANAACPGAPNVLPVADISCPPQAQRDEILVFDAMGSSDADGQLLDYTFDFGDGAAQSGSDDLATYSFTDPGRYTVTVTVTDDRGDTDTASCEVNIIAALQRVTVPFTLNIADAVQSSPAALTFADLPPAIEDVDMRWSWAGCAWGTSNTTTSLAFDINGSFVTVGAAGNSDSCITDWSTSTISSATFNSARDSDGTIAARYWGRSPCPGGVGCSSFGDTAIYQVAFDIDVAEPVPDLVCPSLVNAGATFTLDASGSAAGWGDLVRYSFYDETGLIAASTDPTLDHSIAPRGAQLLSVTIEDQFGLESSVECEIFVQ